MGLAVVSLLVLIFVAIVIALVLARVMGRAAGETQVTSREDKDKEERESDEHRSK